MRAMVLALLILIAGHGTVALASHPDSGEHEPGGRVGLLPEACVESLESVNISEQTALMVGGATVAAIGVGAVAGGAVGGGAAGITLLALFLAHWPIELALLGGTGYLAWSYLWPPPKPLPIVIPPGGTEIRW